jgi:hypothetical protein
MYERPTSTRIPSDHPEEILSAIRGLSRDLFDIKWNDKQDEALAKAVLASERVTPLHLANETDKVAHLRGLMAVPGWGFLSGQPRLSDAARLAIALLWAIKSVRCQLQIAEVAKANGDADTIMTAMQNVAGSWRRAGELREQLSAIRFEPDIVRSGESRDKRNAGFASFRKRSAPRWREMHERRYREVTKLLAEGHKLTEACSMVRASERTGRGVNLDSGLATMWRPPTHHAVLRSYRLIERQNRSKAHPAA